MSPSEVSRSVALLDAEDDQSASGSMLGVFTKVQQQRPAPTEGIGWLRGNINQPREAADGGYKRFPGHMMNLAVEFQTLSYHGLLASNGAQSSTDGFDEGWVMALLM